MWLFMYVIYYIYVYVHVLCISMYGDVVFYIYIYIYICVCVCGIRYKITHKSRYAIKRYSSIAPKRDGNYTWILRVILNKSWRQHHTRHQLYGHLPPITKTIQVRRTRHAGHCWRSRDELISDVLLCTPTYGRAKAGRLARTYIQQLCEDTECSPEDQLEAMNDREKWRERVRDIRARGTTWWWWWWWQSFFLRYGTRPYESGT